MATIECEIEYDSEENDYETESPCIRATCTKCDHETMSYGDSDSSIRRCLAVMNEECPAGDDNFYVEKDDVFIGNAADYKLPKTKN